jgi:hypothetical protein
MSEQRFNFSAWRTAEQRSRVAVADVRRVCEQCGQPFRCPTSQPERFICGPCK